MSFEKVTLGNGAVLVEHHVDFQPKRIIFNFVFDRRLEGPRDFLELYGPSSSTTNVVVPVLVENGWLYKDNDGKTRSRFGFRHRMASTVDQKEWSLTCYLPEDEVK